MFNPDRTPRGEPMALHKDLKTIADWTWLNRVALMEAARRTGRPKGQTHMAKKNRAVDAIYGYICGAVRGRRVEDKEMTAFAATLRNKLVGHGWLSKGLTGSPTYLLQYSEGWPDLGNLNRFPEPSAWVGAFVHVVKQNRPECKERVYLHLKERYRAGAFATIVKKVWDFPGVTSAKVAAPGAVKTDTVLIYCDNARTRDAVIKVVKKYQNKYPHYFGSELPKLVAPAGTGIGFGAEPPQFKPIRPNSNRFEAAEGRQSFGKFRANLIFIALERTLFPEEMAAPDTSRMGIDLRTFDQANRRHGMQLDIAGMQRQQMNAVRNMGQQLEFEQRVEEIFRLAGLDPEHPELQNDPILN
ncbi:T3SS effector HopA1 family protein [Roseibium aggregatum]|uniref:Uncharacterized protein n=1 Tax=Roseibium aggregatum TaxID=187304 RepID=A0A939EBV0_9HYPH|nr:T3SS effector HopA1 family protein [Roseibium aggregatum]MBN9669709.1 hypothetical protein [Roseibium aggregatum]